jgi:hypothetical protein
MIKDTILRPNMRPLAALLTFFIGLTAFYLKSSSLSPVQNINEAKPVPISSSSVTSVTDAKNSGPSQAEDVPEKIKDLEFTAVKVKEENTMSLFKIDIEYPQIRNPSTSKQRRFNKYVKSIVARDVQSFKAFCFKNRTYPSGKRRDMEYFLGGNYEVLYADKNLVSIKITEESFTGYLNSDWYLVNINYDLRNGRLLNLSDLFAPRTNYIKAVSELCIKELKKRDLSCSGRSDFVENNEGALVTMRKGAAPKRENYQHWNITANGIKVTFGEYQIGPGCLGLIDVDVPYDLLRERVSNRSPLSGLMSLK